MPPFRPRLVLLAASLLFLATGLKTALADEKNRHLDIYFIDVEGGAATLFITPAGESLLIDSGYPDNNSRDLNRILKVLKDVAGRTVLDHACVSHWHLDHFGNHAALRSRIEIKNFWDRGIPDRLAEDPMFPERIGNYRAASQNKSNKLVPGDLLPLRQENPTASDKTPLQLKVVTASGEVIPNVGRPNPFAAEHKPQPDDTSDNAQSLSLLLTFGKFTFLCCGDLTWNIEAELMTPNNPLGTVEMFMVTHHGLPVSNNPVLVKAVDPHVAIMCNGPTKGGHPQTQKTLRALKSLEALYQLHRNVDLKPEEQTPPEFIANQEPTAECKGQFIKASIAPGGERYTVQIGNDGQPRHFHTR